MSEGNGRCVVMRRYYDIDPWFDKTGFGYLNGYVFCRVIRRYEGYTLRRTLT
jgi:hypothetical protein